MPHSGLTAMIAMGEAENRRVIKLLIEVAVRAFYLADNTEDDGESQKVVRADFEALSAALDKLDELPDDQPGYIMEGPAKAAWALRALIGGSDGS